MSTGLPGVGIFGTSPAALLLVPALKVLQQWVYVGQRPLGEKTDMKALQFVKGKSRGI